MTDALPTKPPGRARSIAYWALTLIIAWEMAAGSLWDLLGIEFVRGVMLHLGYPLYFLTIIGLWKLPCAMALLAPRFPLLKEWAYAGAFFNYTGAFASHLLAGDGAGKWAGPLVFAGLTLGSRALRPADRRVAPREPGPRARPAEWIVSVGILAAMVLVSLAALPKGPPP